MGRFPEHECEYSECHNLTTNKKYCCKTCCDLAKRGKPLSEETKKKMSEAHSGENNPLYGKHHSDETKKKMRDAKLGKPLSEDHKRKMSESRSGENNHWYGKHHSDKTKKKMSESLKLVHASDEPPKIIQEYQILAYEYYEYECCMCNKSEGKLHVHHLDGNHDNNDPDNLCWICNSCHRRIHGGFSNTIDEELTTYAKNNRRSITK